MNEETRGEIQGQDFSFSYSLHPDFRRTEIVYECHPENTDSSPITGVVSVGPTDPNKQPFIEIDGVRYIGTLLEVIPQLTFHQVVSLLQSTESTSNVYGDD